MTARFEVQARRQLRRNGTVVSDETRHASTAVLDDARRTARLLAAEGFTVWIFRVERGEGTSPVYRSVQTVHPAATTATTAAATTGRDRPRTGRCACRARGAAA